MNDAEIRFSTAIDDSGFESGIESVNDTFKTMSDAVANVAKALQGVFGGAAQKQAQELTDKLRDLKKQYDEILSGKKRPESLLEMEEALASNENLALDLVEKIESLNNELNQTTDLLPEVQLQKQTELDVFNAQLRNVNQEVATISEKIDAIFLDPSTSAEAEQLALEMRKVETALIETSSAAEKAASEVNTMVEPVQQVSEMAGQQADKFDELFNIIEGRGKASAEAVQEINDEIVDLNENTAQVDQTMEAIDIPPALTQEIDRLVFVLGLFLQTLTRINYASNQAFSSIPVQQFSTTINNISPQPVQRLNKEIKETPKHVKKSTSALDGMLKKIYNMVKAIFIFNVLRAALKGLKDYITGLLSTNQEYVRSMNQLKAASATAFQPIIEIVIPIITKLVSALAVAMTYIAAFINMLFGKTVKQSQEAAVAMNKQSEAIKGAGGAAKDASKQLAKFDDINQQTADTAGAMGGAGGGEMALSDIIATELPEIDTSPFTKFIDFLKARFEPEITAFTDMFKREGAAWGALFSRIGEDSKPMMENFKKYLQTDFLDAVGNSIRNATRLVERYSQVFRGFFSLGWELMKPYLDKFFANTLSAVTQNFMKIQDSLTNILMTLSKPLQAVGETIISVLAPILGWFMTDGLELFTRFGADVADILDTLFTVAADIFMKIWKDAVDPAMQLVKKIVLDTLNLIKDFWFTHGESIKTAVKSIITAIGDMFSKAWNEIIKPIFDKLIATITPLWENHIKPVLQKLGELISAIATWIAKMFNDYLKPVFNWIVDTFGPIIVGLFGHIFKVIGDVFSGLLDILGGVMDFLIGVFTGNWEKAWEGIVNIGKGIWNALIGLLEGLVNGLIKTINNLTAGINRVTGVVGIPAIPEIPLQNWPRLAQGGLIQPNNPQLVVVGDNKREEEIVSPRSTIREEVANALIEFFGAGGAQQNELQPIQLYVDGRMFGEAVVDLGDKQRQRRGMRIKAQGVLV